MFIEIKHKSTHVMEIEKQHQFTWDTFDKFT